MTVWAADCSLAVGLWRLTEWAWSLRERLDFVEHCLDRDVVWFDLARVYGAGHAEALFGDTLAALPPSRRAQVRLVTKCGIEVPGLQGSSARVKHYDLSPARIRSSVEQSLQALRTDRVDVLLLHRPSPLMAFDEVAGALQRLVDDGLVGAVGVSNFTQSPFEALHRRIPLVTNQIECSPLHLDPLYNGLLDRLQDWAIRPMFWSALGGGRLFADQAPEPLQRIRRAFAEAAQALGLPGPEAAVYAWLWRLPSRPVLITGSRRVSAIDDAIEASACHMPMELWFELLAVVQGHEVP